MTILHMTIYAINFGISIYWLLGHILGNVKSDFPMTWQCDVFMITVSMFLVYMFAQTFGDVIHQQHGNMIKNIYTVENQSTVITVR
jgi:hypothetical protein